MRTATRKEMLAEFGFEAVDKHHVLRALRGLRNPFALARMLEAIHPDATFTVYVRDDQFTVTRYNGRYTDFQVQTLADAFGRTYVPATDLFDAHYLTQIYEEAPFHRETFGPAELERDVRALRDRGARVLDWETPDAGTLYLSLYTRLQGLFDPKVSHFIHFNLAGVDAGYVTAVYQMNGGGDLHEVIRFDAQANTRRRRRI